jgi:hypothetical protein
MRAKEFKLNYIEHQMMMHLPLYNEVSVTLVNSLKTLITHLSYYFNNELSVTTLLYTLRP